ncbi:hypothetical protein GP486_008299 [Trichoglossum hirsutum]|uniref:Peptidase A1 domain-containing protein n=1 Tax=Trichoglossum hirsutum TaxID=265104 RepID=A0A9P8IGA9_9PEZI|nr:hypothetical protein GP486_008299 [Trichoglossum hirsutum]
MVAGLRLEFVALVGSAVVIGGAVATAVAPAVGPISVPPSQYWDGSDGPWATFALQLGTPSQNVRLLCSTSGSSIWPVLPQGCAAGDPNDCPTRRGFTFKSNASLTWTEVGLFELPLVAERPLGYTGNGDFGFDNVTVGWQGYGGPTLEHQVVAGIATKNFSWMGMLGLTSHGTNFTDFNDPQPSLLTSLKSKGLVSSSSWGYTAGAPYGPKGVYGSLTFGGYDATRFTPNNMTFLFGADISWDLLVGIQDITSTGNSSSSSSIDLLPSGIMALIDSTIPHIWLPVEACQRFEQTFGLVWDQKTDLYLVDDALHSKLVAQAANITFKLGIGTSGGQTVDVVLPYKSFDLQVTLPNVNNSVRYYPLRRASNESQYALGRTFLQEA